MFFVNFMLFVFRLKESVFNLDTTSSFKTCHVKATALKTRGTFITFTIAAPACFKRSHSDLPEVPDSDFCIFTNRTNCMICMMFCELFYFVFFHLP